MRAGGGVTAASLLLQRHLVTSRVVSRHSSSFGDGGEGGGLPAEADTVICGAGVIGSSIAYHLSQLGVGEETVMLDLGQTGGLQAGSAVGLVSVNQAHRVQSSLVRRSQRLYRRLSAQGHDLGVAEVGGLYLARTRERMHHFERLCALRDSLDAEMRMQSLQEVRARCPILETDDLLGAMWIPDDLSACPVRVAATLSGLAQDEGVSVVPDVRVERVLTDGRRGVTGVQTDRGTVRCRRFVNAAGYWSRELALLSAPAVRLPVHACEHFSMQARPLPGLTLSGSDAQPLPVISDPDGRIYVRVCPDGRLLAGGYELSSRPAFESGRVPCRVDARSLPCDWDRFHALLREIVHRVPAAGDAHMDALRVAPETYSPDGQWTVGEAGEARRYYVAAGLGAHGTAAAGGLGQLLAEWIVDGDPSLDVHQMDVRRFLALHNNVKFLRQRIREVPARCMRVPWPFPEYTRGRRLRASPIFSRLKAAGAQFGAVMGYERPAYFQSPDLDAVGPVPCDGGLPIARSDTFYKPHWFDRVGEEYNACRERVAISDYSSFTKIDLLSKDEEVVHYLQRLCSNDVDIAVGNIAHTGMQNRRGGYENDCSLARIARNHYMLICPTVQHARCQSWLQQHAPLDGSVVVNDITSLYTALCVMGPLARELLAELTDTDLDPRKFPFFTFKEIDVGMVSGIRAMNMTHTGELGWVLYVPNEFALYVYDLLVDRGQDYGISLAGYLATRSLRVEKFYAFWGQDLGTTATPLECGRAFRVKFAKDCDFIGRDALIRQRAEGVRRLYVHFTLQDHDACKDPWPWGNEPIYRNGEYVGLVTTACFGYSHGRMICLGFVQDLSASQTAPKIITNDFVLRGQFCIRIGEKSFSGKPSLVSPTLPSKSRDTAQKPYQATQHTTV